MDPQQVPDSIEGVQDPHKPFHLEVWITSITLDLGLVFGRVGDRLEDRGSRQVHPVWRPEKGCVATVFGRVEHRKQGDCHHARKQEEGTTSTRPKRKTVFHRERLVPLHDHVGSRNLK